MEHMEQNHLDSLFGRGELGQGHKMDHFAEPSYNGQDKYVTTRIGKTSNKVQGYVGPWAMRYRERLKQP